MAAGARRQRASTSAEAALDLDLTRLISERVLATGSFLDYVRFRAVCPQWRAAAPSPRGRGLIEPRFHRRRWMLFPEGFGQFPGHRAHGGCARFFDLSTAGAFVRVPLPELKNHCVLDSPDGLLLLQRDEDTAVRLLHPFTSDVAEFPSLKSLSGKLNVLENDSSHSWYNFSVWRYLEQVRKVCAATNVTAAGEPVCLIQLATFHRRQFCCMLPCWRELSCALRSQYWHLVTCHGWTSHA